MSFSATENNKLILEPYKHEGKIKANTTSGFASIVQKSKLVGLKLIVNANITRGVDSVMLSAGTVIYFEEEILHTQAWSQKTYESDIYELKFIIAPASYMVMWVNENN